jgi:DNA-binding CsgD family transcriptional regulator
MRIPQSPREIILSSSAPSEAQSGLNTRSVEPLSVPYRPYERKILNQLIQGKNAKAIAKALGVDSKYVSTVLSTIQKKSQMNLIELVVHYSKLQGEYNA